MAKKGGDLFIEDISISEWIGLEYLRQWTEIAKAMDVATGFFENGSLLAFDGGWPSAFVAREDPNHRDYEHLKAPDSAEKDYRG